VGLPHHSSQASRQHNLPGTANALLAPAQLLQPPNSSIRDSSDCDNASNVSSGYSTPAPRGASFSGISVLSTGSQNFHPLREYDNENSSSGRALQTMPRSSLSEHSFRYPFPGSGTRSQLTEPSFMLIGCCTGLEPL
jgi:hypothetical protein